MVGPWDGNRSLPDTRGTDVGSTGCCFKRFGKDSDTFRWKSDAKDPRGWICDHANMLALYIVSVFREVTPDLKGPKSHFKSAGVKSGDDFESPDYQEDSVMVSIMLAFTCGCHGA